MGLSNERLEELRSRSSAGRDYEGHCQHDADVRECLEEIDRLRAFVGQHCEGCAIHNVCPGVGLETNSAKMGLVRYLRGE